MNFNDIKADEEWSHLSYEQKNHELFFRQKRTLELFLARKAISQAQYEKSLHELVANMKKAG